MEMAVNKVAAMDLQGKKREGCVGVRSANDTFCQMMLIEGKDMVHVFAHRGQTLFFLSPGRRVHSRGYPAGQDPILLLEQRTRCALSEQMPSSCSYVIMLLNFFTVWCRWKQGPEACTLTLETASPHKVFLRWCILYMAPMMYAEISP